MTGPAHEPTLYTYGPTEFWFECSCGFMGDLRHNIYLASIRWQLHIQDVAQNLMRAACEQGPIDCTATH